MGEFKRFEESVRETLDEFDWEAQTELRKAMQNVVREVSEKTMSTQLTRIEFQARLEQQTKEVFDGLINSESFTERLRESAIRAIEEEFANHLKIGLVNIHNVLYSDYRDFLLKIGNDLLSTETMELVRKELVKNKGLTSDVVYSGE